jgi:co-chaperonin GroES (HSP10)
MPLDVKANARILFGKWSGTEVKLDVEELLIMAEVVAAMMARARSWADHLGDCC